MEDQGIMALGQGMQAPTAQPPAVDPAAEAAFEQARLQMDPKEVGDELLSAGEQIDPAAVQEFKAAIEQLQLPPEIIDALGQMVDAILAEPQNYQENRAELLQEGVPEDLLPPEFDAGFFGALNMALDQMSGMQQPMAMGPEGFAAGGIAQLNPIAAGLAQMGRNGDTMLAHITPAEARMLRRRGGSGTINPATGLPEFSLKKAFKSVGNAFKSVGKAVSGAVKSIGKAVKKFASSSVGKLVTTVALGFFLGPAAASMLGVGSAAGVAAVSGFVGSFGSTMLAGGNLKDALKAGATSALLAGGGAALAGGSQALQAGSYTGPTTISGQFDKFKEGVGSLLGGAPAEGVPTAGMATEPSAVSQMAAEGVATPVQPMPADVGYYPTVQADALNVPTVPGQVQALDAAPAAVQAGAAPVAAGQAPTGFLDRMTQGAKDLYGNYISPNRPFEGQIDVASRLSELKKLHPGVSEDILYKTATAEAAKAAPGMFTRYAPMVAGATGVAALSGAFTPKPPEPLNLAPKETGFDLLRQQPGIYGTQPGGAQTTYASTGPMGIASDPYRFQRPSIQMRAPQYPTFAANGGIMQLPTRQQFAQGGIAAIAPRRFNLGGVAGGGPGKFPRRNGQISGPGTETSDEIPAMLSDGEFVMTAKAVRGAGNGSRREGAKRMYQMMHKFERSV